MDWIVLAIIVFAVGGFLFLRFGGTVSTDEARRHLREGALLVDVRTPEEFAGGPRARSDQHPALCAA